MKTRAWLWRLRRNPLRRRSDVAEAWVLLAAGVLMAGGGSAVGVVTAVGVQDYLHDQRAGRHEISVVLTGDAERSARAGGAGGSYTGRVRAPVAWHAADGSARHARVTVSPGLESGDRTTVWTDRSARHVVPPPASAAEAELQSAFTGASAAIGVSALTLLGAAAVRRRFDRERAARWEAEWARIGPDWGRKRA